MARERPSIDPITRPNARTFAVGLLVLIAAIGIFILGQSTGTRAATEASASARSAPPPTSTLTEDTPSQLSPSALPEQLTVPVRGARVGDVLGEVTELGGMVFTDGTRATVVCSDPDGVGPDGIGRGALVAVLRIGLDDDGDEVLISYDRVPLGPFDRDEWGRCDQCSTSGVTLASAQAEPMLLGECSRSIRPEISVGFVVAEPTVAGRALAFSVGCGFTSIEVENNALVVQGRIVRGEEDPDLLHHPPVRLQRRGGWFVADDIDILTHFCFVGAQSQLQGVGAGYWQPRPPDLSYLVKDSAVGKIGFRGPILVALSYDQCGLLANAQAESYRPGPAAFSTSLAKVSGLPAPDGYDDWFLVCQPEL